MKKIFMVIALCLVCMVNFMSCSKSKDIGKLISLRNEYQAEYDLYHARWDLRLLERYGNVADDDDYFCVATFEEYEREQLCKDSIEILNIEIEKYKNH